VFIETSCQKTFFQKSIYPTHPYVQLFNTNLEGLETSNTWTVGVYLAIILFFKIRVPGAVAEIVSSLWPRRSFAPASCRLSSSALEKDFRSFGKGEICPVHLYMATGTASIRLSFHRIRLTEDFESRYVRGSFEWHWRLEAAHEKRTKTPTTFSHGMANG
jgi:hypothetical protein